MNNCYKYGFFLDISENYAIFAGNNRTIKKTKTMKTMMTKRMMAVCLSILLPFCLFTFLPLSAVAQRIKAVDAKGHAISLVSVLTEDGRLIGTTNMNGILADVKGAEKVILTHVAYMPQQVTVAALKDGIVTLKENDYNLTEVVVKPKPYLYMEYYYRGFRFIGDSLRAYSAGIYPVIYKIADNFEPDTRTHWSYGAFANRNPSWHSVVLENQAKKAVKSAITPIEQVFKEQDFFEKYRCTIEQVDEGRWIVKNPEGQVGDIVHKGGQSLVTLDGGKMQMYSNEAHGEKKQLERRQEMDYAYEFTQVFELDDDGKIQHDNFVMLQDHWEYNTKKGREKLIIYIYAADRGYVDGETFKARSKELNKGYVGNMQLEELLEYVHQHHIPELPEPLLENIRNLKKKN